MEELNVFDFDKTIYNGDSSIDFYIYALKSNMWLIRYLPIQIYGMLAYKLKIKPKEYFKEKYFSFLNGMKDIEANVEKFWDENKQKIKYNIFQNKKNMVVISASPEFLLAPICKQIGVQKLIATKVEEKTGKFLGKNCYGEEKVNRLNKEYKNYVINEFYSDSVSDRFLAQISKKSFLVSKNKVQEWKVCK